MRQTTNATGSAIRTAEDSENILGQFFYALGQGAGAIRVQRAAIAALRARYLGPIQAAQVSWNDIAGNVLSLVAQVGRLAALLATQDGRTSISETDFTRARQLVEAHVHLREDWSGKLHAGIICPPVAEETHPIPQRPEISADAGQPAPDFPVLNDGWSTGPDPASSQPRTH